MHRTAVTSAKYALAAIIKHFQTTQSILSVWEET